MSFAQFADILEEAGGQNSASCGVVVGASALAQPYIHWLLSAYVPHSVSDRGRARPHLDGLHHMENPSEPKGVSLGPIRLTHFEHGGRRYAFRKPVVVSVEFTDGLWIYRNEGLNLWGYGASRDDALADLHDNLAYLWKEFAEEADEVLDERAKLLKQALLDLQPVESAVAG